MDNKRWAVGTLGAITLFLLPALAAISEEKPKVSSLDDYPPAVVQHLLTDFALQKKALEEEGVPATIDDLPGWNACASNEDNAYPKYVAAFAAEVLSERLGLLAEAAALPCYQYPFKSGLWSGLFGNTVDVTSGMREASRLLASEISVQTALGDSERAVRNAEAGFGLVGHFAKAPTNLVQLSRYACQELIIGSFQDMLSGATLTEAQLVRLNQALVRAYDPAVLARTWIAEKVTNQQSEPFESCPTIHLHDARSRAQLLAARAAVAVERYRLAQGALPVALSELVPIYLPEVPLDPFNGKTLYFVTSDEAYAVFSVDDDGAACPNPLEVVRGDERSMVRISIEKKPKPLSELYYEEPRGSGEGNTRTEKKSIESVASMAAKALPRNGANILRLSAGPVDGGIAVLLNAVTSGVNPRESTPVLAAFWVHDGAIHTVNNWARDIVPDLPPAPEAITFDRVRDVVH